ncbi:MAG: GPR endopeptidase [Clostridia bacterium]|nr:GPR endopeptidase [Clostridia bacterium]
MEIRTDLITERREMDTTQTKGAVSKTVNIGSVSVEYVEINTESATIKLQKPIGKYYTLEFERLDKNTDTKSIKTALVSCLNKLIKKSFKNFLIVGLGNADITPDALGPLVANRILATRHLDENFKKRMGLTELRSVAVITPGVLGKTGIEASENVLASCKKIKPEVIIVIDALAARNPSRLCSTIQLSNTGISPGSGVGNSRKSLNFDTFGVPVIAIGIPTVIDSKTFRYDCNGAQNDDLDMMVTPKEIDVLIKNSADILSLAINLFLQPSLDEETIKALI